jgi:hypothetical protein
MDFVYSFELFIAMGVNSSASYDIHNTNYLTPSALDTDITFGQKAFSTFAAVVASLKFACAWVMSTASSIRHGAEMVWFQR